MPDEVQVEPLWPGASWGRGGGWTWRRTPGGKWAQAIPYEVIVQRVMVGENGLARGLLVRFATAAGLAVPLEIPTAALSAQSPARAIRELDGPALTGPQGTSLAEILSEAAAGMAGEHITTELVITRAEWVGDDLHVPTARMRAAPGSRTIAKYGDVPHPEDEPAARRAWAEVVEIASAEGNERLVIALGMPLGSIFAQRLGLDTFALHVKGDTTQGKTQDTISAMCELGDAAKPHGPLYDTWNASARATGNDMKERGILPLYLDEAASSDMTDEQFSRTIFEMMQGKSRRVAGTEGANLTGSDERWYASVLSTGEVGLAAKSNLGGSRRRVMELHAPLTTTDLDGSHDPGADSTRASQLARGAHGWPLRWLAADPDPEEFRRVRREIELAMVAAMEDHEERTAFVELGNVATCAAGFALLGRLATGEWATDAAKAAAIDVQDQLTGDRKESGVGLADRVVLAIRDHKATFTRDWPEAKEEPYGIRRMGVRFADSEGEVGILSKAVFRELVPGHDPDTVLEALRDAGRLRTQKSRRGGKVQRRVWQDGEVVQQLIWVVVVGDDG